MAVVTAAGILRGKGFGAWARWTPPHDLAALHQVNALEVPPLDAVKLMKLSHIVRLELPLAP